MRAAAVQLNATDDPDRAQATAERLVREAAARGATLVVLPEKWPALGTTAILRAAAEPLDGPRGRWAAALAQELGIDLVAGSVSEARPGTGRLSNTSVHYGPDGAARATYRKVHLFDVDVDGHRYRESDAEDAGDELVLTHTADGVGVGLSICYDLRFAELYRRLTGAGARVLAVPAAFTLATTRDHWELLLRARAVENQAFVVAANQVGEHPGGARSGGRSMIVDPWGLVLAQVPDGEGVCLADLDLGRQDEVRRTLPALAHGRPGVYAGEVVVR
ncbi:carbon-nitrogen hydrolase family protein [Paraconexibacter antarcticus]|uniref:Carbon-nitrogen hydrolase family protein n=1 Tax=Paraconexibacter antarcticus TaxID=2949664 RepID=A0ABY5DXR8_9ACTN|nr:carbon-nitrogen hydrolase family protein [Paraconexibacter antarcticus]UTI65714.1 carbon-nitrogen hydrolase family protein [Paraconexibacter antarcticus]